MSQNGLIIFGRFSGRFYFLTYRSQEAEAKEVVGLIEKKGRSAAVIRLDAGDISSFSRLTSEISSILQKKWNRDKFDCLINNGGGGVRDNAQLNSFVASQTALGHAGLPDDIGGAVSMLLSDEAHWITGQRIEASGGMFL